VIRLLVLLPLLALDCLANMLLGGSWRNTLSAEAWHARDHKYWGWTHRVIDALFFWQAAHCMEQAAAEERHGGAWGVWRHAWQNAGTNHGIS
jgi:hypothetical protein